MRAVRAERYGGPEVLALEHLSVPTPGEGEVLVGVEAAGVNFIDTYHRRGIYRVPVPVALGLEGAGTVLEVGPEAAGWAPGDRVAWTGIPGSYATHLLAPARRLVPLPDEIPFVLGAAALLQGMTAHYLTSDSFPLAPGDTCLVHAAAGGVGLLLCQMAQMRGAEVIGTASTAEKAELALAAGARHVILYRDQDFVAEVARLTGGRGCGVVYDGVGRDTFERSLDCLAVRGTMILFGQSSGLVDPVDPLLLCNKGSLFFQRPMLAHHTATRKELLERAEEVLGRVAGGALQVRVGATYPLAEAEEAHRALEGRLTTGKVLLLP